MFQKKQHEMIQYDFRDSIKQLMKYSPNTHYFVFLHKNDLTINRPNYHSILSQIKEQFQLECSEKVYFFRTSIYRPETVIDSFGRIIEIVLPNISKSEYVEGRKIEKVEEFAENIPKIQESIDTDVNISEFDEFLL